MKNWIFLGIVLSFLSGCAITRYYQTDQLTAQLGPMKAQLNENLAKIDADYSEKKRFVSELEKRGADLKKEPFSGLAGRMETLNGAHKTVEVEVESARRRISSFEAKIAGKQRISSDDPAFDEVDRFEDRSEEDVKQVTAAYGRYREASNAFLEYANALKTSLRKPQPL